MFYPNEVLQVLECLLLLCGSATAEATSPVTYMVYATVALRLLAALIQMAWILARLARRVRRGHRQRARVRRQTVPPARRADGYGQPCRGPRTLTPGAGIVVDDEQPWPVIGWLEASWVPRRRG